MGSDERLGSLLRMLARSKPGGRMLELGTGTGLATSWILDGMDTNARLTTVDSDRAVLTIAEQNLGSDPRLHVVHQEGRDFLLERAGERFDLIFADAWSGKFFDLDEALAMVASGGFYVADDLSPQEDWTSKHAEMVEEYRSRLAGHDEFAWTWMDWASGLVVGTRAG